MSPLRLNLRRNHLQAEKYNIYYMASSRSGSPGPGSPGPPSGDEGGLHEQELEAEREKTAAALAAVQDASSLAKALKFQLDITKKKAQQYQEVAEEVKTNFEVTTASFKAEVHEMESWAVEECLAHADTRAVLAALRKEWADKEAELLAELAKRGVELEEAKSAIDQARYPLHSPATTGGLGSAHPDPDTHLCPAPAIQLVSQLEAEEEKNRQERERTRRATLQAAHEAELRREVEQSRWKSPRTAPGAKGAHRWPQGRPRPARRHTYTRETGRCLPRTRADSP